MRTIKFRGKDFITNECVYGSLVKVNFKDRYFIGVDGDPILSQVVFVEVYKETIGQFTGLYDKNGNEIYEGDIVTDSSNRLMKIVWYNNGFILEAIKETNFKYGTLINWFIKETNKCDLEVIDNINNKKEIIENE